MVDEIQHRWNRLFQSSGDTDVYRQVLNTPLPASDWESWSRQKVDDFLRTVIAAVHLLGKGSPYSTLETGVYAGGTSAVFMSVVAHQRSGSSIHIGIDPFFMSQQSYRPEEKEEDYGLSTYLTSLSTLSRIAENLETPYVPYVMSSQEFIAKDLLPDGFDFRLFHLDGDHSASAVFEELRYFGARVTQSAVFILDDIGEVFHGIEEAIRQYQNAFPGFTELSRFLYPTRGGRIGFGVYHLSANKDRNPIGRRRLGILNRMKR